MITIKIARNAIIYWKMYLLMINKVLRVKIFNETDTEEKPISAETIDKKVQTILSRIGQQWDFIDLLHEPAINLKQRAPQNSQGLLILMQTDRSSRKTYDERKDNDTGLYFGNNDQWE